MADITLSGEARVSSFQDQEQGKDVHSHHSYSKSHWKSQVMQ